MITATSSYSDYWSTTLRNPSSRMPRVFWSLVSIVFCTTATASFLLGVLLNNNGLFLCAFSCLPSLVICGAQWVLADRDIVSPLNFVLLTVFLGTTVRTFYIVFVDNNFVNQQLMLGQPLIFLQSGLWAILLGVMFLMIGYFSPVLHWKRIERFWLFRNERWSDRGLLIVATVMIIVATVCGALYLKEAGVLKTLATQFSVKRTHVGPQNSSLGYLRWGIQLYQVSFLLLLVRYLEKHISLFSWRTLGLVLLGIFAVAFPFLTSSRTELIYVIVYALVIIHYGTKGLRIKAVLVLVAICIFIIGGMGVIRYVQQHKLAQEGYGQYVRLQSFYEKSLGDRQFLGVAKTSQIIRGVPRKLDYQYGKTFGLWLVAPIPRSIWPDKPVVRIGGVLGPSIFGDSMHSGTPPGFIGELFYNFGWLGIPLGMLLLGMWLKFIYVRIGSVARRNKNIRLIYTYLLVGFSYTLLSEDFTGVMAEVLSGIIPLLLIFMVIGQPRLFTDTFEHDLC